VIYLYNLGVNRQENVYAILHLIPYNNLFGRKALLALMRVVPKDGRMHQSHSLFGYFYNHCHSIMSEVERLRLQGAITREQTPCIMVSVEHLSSNRRICCKVLQGMSPIDLRMIAGMLGIQSDWWQQSV